MLSVLTCPWPWWTGLDPKVHPQPCWRLSQGLKLNGLELQHAYFWFSWLPQVRIHANQKARPCPGSLKHRTGKRGLFPSNWQGKKIVPHASSLSTSPHPRLSWEAAHGVPQLSSCQWENGQPKVYIVLKKKKKKKTSYFGFFLSSFRADFKHLSYHRVTL